MTVKDVLAASKLFTSTSDMIRALKNKAIIFFEQIRYKLEGDKNMTVKDVLAASKLFTSTSDMIRALKNKAIKINGLAIEDLNESIEKGDFLNFCWLPGAIQMVQEHGLVFLAVSRGKDAGSKAIVKMIEDKFVHIA